MKKQELEAARMFFISLYSKSIQMVDCTGSEVSLVNAEARMAEEWPVIALTLPRMFENVEFINGKFLMISHPMTHELFDDKPCTHYYTERAHLDHRAQYKNDFGLQFKAWTMMRREKKYDVGKVTFEISLYDMLFSMHFENKEFKHGHITDGKVDCWGSYANMYSLVAKQGIVAMLSSMYNFAKYSRYLTYDAKEKEEYAGKSY